MENNQEDSQEAQNQSFSFQLENILLDFEQAELTQNNIQHNIPIQGNVEQQNQEVFVVPIPAPDVPQPNSQLDRPILTDSTPTGQATTTTTTAQPNQDIVNTNQEQHTTTNNPERPMEAIAQLLNNQQNSGPITMTLSMVRNRKMMESSHNLSEQTKSRQWQETLKCVTCNKLPKLGPTYTCSNGHLICQNCNGKVSICPACRDPVMTNKNIITEAVLETYLKDNYENCLYEKGGCKVKTTLEELQYHEPLCPFMEVTCPGKCQGCTWRGPKSRLFSHISEQSKQLTCVDIVRSCNRHKIPNQHLYERYTCIIRDFKESEETAFLKQVDINWKPILHIPFVTNKTWTYLVVSRGPTGIWKFLVKGYLPQYKCDEVKACITISTAKSASPSNGIMDNALAVSFAGGITSHWATDRDAWDMGRCLLISDNTIAQFRHPTEVTKLFNYTVTMKYREPAAREPIT
jgi:hypothetical protein